MLIYIFADLTTRIGRWLRVDLVHYFQIEIIWDLFSVTFFKNEFLLLKVDSKYYKYYNYNYGI